MPFLTFGEQYYGLELIVHNNRILNNNGVSERQINSLHIMIIQLY